EERPEQHRLGDDEEQDPQGLAIDLGGLVSLRRPVMVAVAGRGSAGGERCGLHQASPPVAAPTGSGSRAAPSPPDSKCSTGAWARWCATARRVAGYGSGLIGWPVASISSR